MPISINTNTAAFDAARNLQLTSQDFVQAVQRLSSGLRINSAADDPAGNSIAQTLLARINGYDQAQRNIQDAVSLVQQANAGLAETQTVLQRMNQLAIQASNDTLTTTDRQNIQQEVVGLISEVDRVAQQTTFNTKPLLNGTAGGASITFTGGGGDITNVQVQAGVTPNNLAVSVTNMVTQGVKSSITAAAAPTLSYFAGGGSITITGPTGISQTFTSTANEPVSTFISQVNNADIGVTASVGGGGQLTLTSRSFGLKNGSNATGPQNITATGSATDPDFSTGQAGANLGLIQTSPTPPTSVSGVNAQINVNGTTFTLQGANSDQFQGTGATSGVTFQFVNPGLAVGALTDAFTVTQYPALNMQVGANALSTISVAIDSQSSQALGVNNIDVTTATSAENAITATQNAINQVSAEQAKLGAVQNVFTDAQTGAGAFENNLIAARSNIVDANIAQETVRFTTDQILMQAGTAVLSQANQAPAGLLGLLSVTSPAH